jgi:NAD(P)-dependent dehydrogenase (short-subunit alcohol dehydrogenase family)
MTRVAAPRSPVPTLQGRIALITGASRGIGAAVAERFAREGAHVILAARTQEGLEATDDAVRAAGGSATLVPLDLRDYGKIPLLAAMVAQRFGKLDILLGNAAMLSDLTPLPQINPEDWDKVMGLNVSANWHLIRAFDALLQQSDAPRALFVTSGVTRKAAAYWGAYAASKAALEAMVAAWAAETGTTRLRVNLIDPGRVRTRMRARAYPGEDPQSLPAPADITDMFVRLARPDCDATGTKCFVN